MANAAILGAGTTAKTVMSAADATWWQDTSATTRAKSGTFALMGGLEVNNQTITTTDVTGAVGQLYVCTIAGLTATRNLTLPSANVGERVGVYIVDGDDAFELVIKGAALQTINGGAAATEWSRLFIQGECVVCRCVAADTWIVEVDGRIPCCARMEQNAQQTGIVTSTWTTVAYNVADFDTGDIADLANNRFNLRRAGVFVSSHFIQIGGLGTDVRIFGRLHKNGAVTSRRFFAGHNRSTSAGSVGASGIATSSVVAGDNISTAVFHEKGTNASTDYAASDTVTFFETTEIF